MSFNDLYLHYKSLVHDACSTRDFDRIIESAFNDYLKGRMTDTEYGKIYFACIAKCNTL